MPNVDPLLQAQIEANPEDVYRVIVRVDGDLDIRAEQLETEGFTITRHLRLIRGFSASAKGSAVQKATTEEWIISIERDQEVHALTPE